MRAARLWRLGLGHERWPAVSRGVVGQEEGLEPQLLLRAGAAPTDATTAAVAALAREVVLNRGKVSDMALAAATAAGLSAEAVLEVVLECAFASLVGLIDNLAGHVELDAVLVPRAWSPEKQAGRS